MKRKWGDSKKLAGVINACLEFEMEERLDAGSLLRMVSAAKCTVGVSDKE